MLDFFVVWFDRLRAYLIGRWGCPEIHDYRAEAQSPIKCRIAITGYDQIRGSGGGLYGFLAFGESKPNPGDVLQADTPEHGQIELVVLRVKIDDSRWGEGTSYGVARLSEWQKLFHFHGKLRTTYPYDSVSRLEKIIWGLVDQEGGSAKLRWHYVQTKTPRGHLDFVAEDEGMVITAVREAA